MLVLLLAVLLLFPVLTCKCGHCGTPLLPCTQRHTVQKLKGIQARWEDSSVTGKCFAKIRPYLVKNTNHIMYLIQTHLSRRFKEHLTFFPAQPQEAGSFLGVLDFQNLNNFCRVNLISQGYRITGIKHVIVDTF